MMGSYNLIAFIYSALYMVEHQIRSMVLLELGKKKIITRFRKTIQA